MKGPELPNGVFGHAMINLGNEKIMVIGGWTGFYSNQTFVYNHDNNTWSSGPSLNEARYDHAVGIVTDEATQEKFVVVTGGTNLYTLNSTEILINGTFSIGKMYLFQEDEKPEMGFAKYSYGNDKCL